MQYSRNKYEELINFSPLFTIDREQNPVEYEKEARRLLELIAEYYNCYIYPNTPEGCCSVSYGLILMEAYKKCIKFYNAQNGQFLPYLKSVMNKDMNMDAQLEKKDSVRGGIKGIPQERKIAKLMSYIIAKGLDITDKKVQQNCAKFLKCDVSQVQQMLLDNHQLQVSHLMVENDDGELVENSKINVDKTLLADQVLEQGNSLFEKIQCMQLVYNGFQNRQSTRKIVSMIMTSMLIKSSAMDNVELLALHTKYTFVDKALIELFVNNNVELSRRQIAEQCGVMEQNVSRTAKLIQQRLSEKFLQLSQDT